MFFGCMAKAKKKAATGGAMRRGWRWLRRRILRAFAIVFLLFVAWVGAYTVLNPPTTPYMYSEGARLGRVDQDWVKLEDVAGVMARSVVAAEDANFCLHWGMDTAALRLALEEGAVRGGSTISQQVAKNVFLWQGRSWARKGLEALMTPVIEALWTKRRIVEVYLNVIEFDEGVFGVEAAARHYFGVGPEDLSAVQAARLAAILPNPKVRSAARPSAAMQRKAARIVDGARTIAADGRAACFED